MFIDYRQDADFKHSISQWVSMSRQTHCKKVTFVLVDKSDFFVGAGKGNRTLLSSLGSLHSTDELYPQMKNAQPQSCASGADERT